MCRYLLRRSLIGILVLIASIVVFFYIMRLLPGSPIGNLAGSEHYNVETENVLTQKFGLDKPIYVQLILYAKGLLQGDFGYSYINNNPVWNIISGRIYPTLVLVIPATIISFIAGILLSLKSIRSVRLTKLLNKISAFMTSIPVYVLSIFLIYILSYGLKLFPPAGMYDARIKYQGMDRLIDLLKHITLPLLSICLIDVVYYYRILRSSLSTELTKNYCRYLFVNGVSEKTIYRKYVLKNAIMPTINILSFSMTRIVTGALYIEIVFAWPGIGRLIYDSILKRDYMVLSAAFFLIVLFIITFMILIDIVYVALDPRVRRRTLK